MTEHHRDDDGMIELDPQVVPIDELIRQTYRDVQTVKKMVPDICATVEAVKTRVAVLETVWTVVKWTIGTSLVAGGVIVAILSIPRLHP